MSVVRAPASVPGHWTSDDGCQMAVEYAAKSRADLAMPELPDLALANAQYLCDRWDLQLIHFQTAAKERIRWLSVQLALSHAALQAVSAVRPSNWNEDDDAEFADDAREHRAAWEAVDAALAKAGAVS